MTDKPINSGVMLQYDINDVSVHSITQQYQGFFSIVEYNLQHKLYSGQSSNLISREVFERGDAVVVMPYDKVNDKVLLLEQFRVGAIKGTTTPWLLEFIAGMFDKDESPVEVAIREAQEEANLILNQDSLVPIMQYLSSPGGMSEKIHLYLAHFDSTKVNCNKVYGLDSEDEDIKLHLVSREKAIDLLSQGKITNAATIIGLQWLALNYLSLTANKESERL